MSEVRSASRDTRLVPDDLPWLAHTAYWRRFDERERLRANQLMGLLVNEICYAGEHLLVCIALGRALRGRRLAGRWDLRRRLGVMIDDELRHMRWFAAFNRDFAPELYRTDALFFLPLGPRAERLMRLLTRLPGSVTLCTWLTLATEEWACDFARNLAASSTTPLDQGYARLHARHLREELPHLQVDAELLALGRHRLPRPVQRAMVAAASRALTIIMRPRVAAAAMIERFVEEFPRWHGQRRALLQAVRAVGRDPRYWRSPGVAGDHRVTRATARRWQCRWRSVVVDGHA